MIGVFGFGLRQEFKLATVTYTMTAVAAVEATQQNGGNQDLQYSMVDSDLDAEGEDDPEIHYPVQDVKSDTGEDDLELSEADAEGEELDDDEEDDGEGVGAVKIPEGRAELGSDGEAELDDAVSEEDDSVAEEEEDDSDKDSSEAESDVEEGWEAASEGAEEASVEVSNRNNCMWVELTQSSQGCSS